MAIKTGICFIYLLILWDFQHFVRKRFSYFFFPFYNTVYLHLDLFSCTDSSLVSLSKSKILLCGNKHARRNSRSESISALNAIITQSRYWLGTEGTSVRRDSYDQPHAPKYISRSQNWEKQIIAESDIYEWSRRKYSHAMIQMRDKTSIRKYRGFYKMRIEDGRAERGYCWIHDTALLLVIEYQRWEAFTLMRIEEDHLSEWIRCNRSRKDRIGRIVFFSHAVFTSLSLFLSLTLSVSLSYYDIKIW